MSLCKILYAKLYDEEQTLPNAPLRAQFGMYGNTAELSTSIRELYRDANAYDNRVYSLRIPGYKRSRGVFDDPIKVVCPGSSSDHRTIPALRYIQQYNGHQRACVSEGPFCLPYGQAWASTSPRTTSFDSSFRLSLPARTS